MIPGHRMMLDSLLIGLARERFGQEVVPLPLKRSHGIVHASQMLAGVPEVPMVRSTTYIQSFIRVLLNEPHIIDMLAKQPTPSSMNHGSGPNSNIESIYQTHNIPAVYFLGVGDVERIRSLCMTLVHIGSQAHKGNGEVERCVVTEVDVDPTWFGIVGRYQDERVVLRPIPERLTRRLPPGTGGFRNAETWHYPFFSGHPKAVVEPCLVPPFSNGDYFHRDVIRALYRI
jgi:hypothetical protein